MFHVLMSILLGILTLFTVLVILLPLYNKRPIIITKLEENIFLLLLSTIVAIWLHPIVLVLTLVIAIVMYYNDHWIVYGISRENTVMAFQKAIIATRSTSKIVENGMQINGDVSVKIYDWGSNICFIQYSFTAYPNSKKSKLTKSIFAKFIRNYKFI